MDYFDASVLVSVLFAEPLSVHVDQHIACATQPLIVSDFGTAEVSSSVSRLVRTNRLDLDQGAALLAEFDNWRADVCEPVETITEDIAAAIHIVRRFDLMIRTPDAINLAICHRIGARMITLDRRLHTAAQMVGVPALDPAEA
jgi:predicted nucleic acid-binding protein